MLICGISCSAADAWRPFNINRNDRVKRLLNALTGLLLALSAPATALAETNLVLPQNANDIRELTRKSEAGPCTRCGVVTNIRSENRPRPQAPKTASPAGTNLQTTPILSGGSAAKDARNASKPVAFYKMTVRMDDGTFTFFEQDDKPSVAKGDRVEIVEGRVEPRLN